MKSSAPGLQQPVLSPISIGAWRVHWIIRTVWATATVSPRTEAEWLPTVEEPYAGRAFAKMSFSRAASVCREQRKERLKPSQLNFLDCRGNARHSCQLDTALRTSIRSLATGRSERSARARIGTSAPQSRVRSHASGAPTNGRVKDRRQEPPPVRRDVSCIICLVTSACEREIIVEWQLAMYGPQNMLSSNLGANR